MGADLVMVGGCSSITDVVSGSFDCRIPGSTQVFPDANGARMIPAGEQKIQSHLQVKAGKQLNSGGSAPIGQGDNPEFVSPLRRDYMSCKRRRSVVLLLLPSRQWDVAYCS
jgi:hypothetical protein